MDGVSLKTFCEGWLTKAAGYNNSVLSDSFDKFFTIFVAYNALYNQVTRWLRKAGRIQTRKDYDYTSATVNVPSYLGHERMANLIKSNGECRTKVTAITKLIRDRTFYIHVVNGTGEPNYAEDRKHVNRIESGSDKEFCESLLTLIYKTRCNMFHGEKAYREEQLSILNPMTYVLEFIVRELIDFMTIE
ncbi:hypothetical protein MUO65_04020 [bacterium]|nr:hypothetical protein [bacterium]